MKAIGAGGSLVMGIPGEVKMDKWSAAAEALAREKAAIAARFDVEVSGNAYLSYEPYHILLNVPIFYSDTCTFHSNTPTFHTNKMHISH